MKIYHNHKKFFRYGYTKICNVAWSLRQKRFTIYIAPPNITLFIYMQDLFWTILKCVVYILSEFTCFELFTILNFLMTTRCDVTFACPNACALCLLLRTQDISFDSNLVYMNRTKNAQFPVDNSYIIITSLNQFHSSRLGLSRPEFQDKSSENL